MPESYPELIQPFEDEARITLTSLPDARRLGVRTPIAFGVYVTSKGRRNRARAAELSTTGVVLDFRHSEECSTEGLVTLELFVPGQPRPIRTAARFARRVGKLLAFEFMVIGRDDRLTLAEHIDRVQAARRERLR
ncbi:MAG TPA: hypothetical protein VGQ57_17375 [Polyangiaceae bacterium]|jgi:hypothetical protein|nr:hypothetical protein [Polyangiaceae bacterium]